MTKLIASDIDGTLLQNGKRELDPQLFDVIMALKKKGIAFVAASGRPFSNLRKIFAPVKDDIYYIAENGTLYYYKALECTCEIERPDGIEILKFIKDDTNCEILLATANMSYTESKNIEYIDYIRNVIKYDLTVVDDITKVTDPFIKIAVCDTRGIVNSFDCYYEKFSQKFSVVTSGNIWLDIIPKNASKGAALTKLLKKLCIDPKDIISFGDQYNDIEMIKLSGKGYAVESGQEKVKECADAICKDPLSVMKDILKNI
jgi:Cof subfamily protein (haloacid dehalogenase superfamily)